MTKWNRLKGQIVSFVVVMAAVAAVYSNTPRSWFHGDDFSHLYEGKHYDDAAHLKEFFLPPKGTGYYRPLDRALDVVQYRLFKERAACHHWFSLVLYALNIWAFVGLVRDWSRSAGLAWMAGTLFLVQPIHVEPVAWAVQRNILCCAFFYLLSLRLLLRSFLGRARRGSLWAAACFLACVMFYDGGFSLPLVWVAMGCAFVCQKAGGGERGENTRRVLIALTVPIAAAVLYAAFYFLFLGAGHRLEMDGWILKKINFYFRDMVWPRHNRQFDELFGVLSPTNKYGAIHRWAVELGLWLSLLMALRLLGGAGLGGFGMAWTLFGLAPFVTVYSERYSYIASFGFCLLLAAAIHGRLFGRRSGGSLIINRALAAAVFLSIVFLHAKALKARESAWREAGEINKAQLAELNREAGEFVPDGTLSVLGPPTDFLGAPGVTYMDRALDVFYGRPETIGVQFDVRSNEALRQMLAAKSDAENPLRIVVFCYNLPPMGRYVNVTASAGSDRNSPAAPASGLGVYRAGPNSGPCMRCKTLLVCGG